MIDELTQRWIRNEADAKAAVNGCRFDLDRACYTVWWIERYCRLYQGEWAGEPLVLRGAHSMAVKAILEPWDEETRRLSLERANEYAECFAAGELCDWQYECTMRVFGWVHFSERWNREVRRFRRGAIFTPKKNKKSPTLAAWGLYLLCGDGEQGQCVFLAAKDGSQARDIAGTHTIQMVRSSPELSQECEVNLSRYRITHLPTRSYLEPLSSGSIRSQQAKQGLNGSVLIDEVHVVNREFISESAIDRAGISRSEPLLMQFSTGGKDPDSYGKEEFDYGTENNKTGKDENYFFAYYGADQKLTDEQLAVDPASIITNANPAIGHTVDLNEALADYRSSTLTPGRLADFKTFRLDIWQRAANPWLRPDSWIKCQREFTAESLQGQPCGAGFDLGLVDDMAALSLVFPEDSEQWSDAASELSEGDTDNDGQPDADTTRKLLVMLEQPVKVLVWYWLPEGAVVKYGHEVSYDQWARDGRLRLTSGDTINPTEILSDLREIFKQYEVLMFGHDPWHAALIVDAMKEQDGFPDDACWPFTQTVRSFAFPSALFERLVVAGKLHHNGHPIASWQAGHVTVKTDNNGNMRPIKPPRKDRKKIDGIVATIMGLDAALRMRAAQSVYETRGFLKV